MSGNKQSGASVCCLFIFVLFMMAIIYFIYGALPLAIGGAIIIPMVILLFYANKSKQKNRQKSSNTSTDEYEKWKMKALSQRQEKETPEDQQNNSQTNQQPSTNRAEKEPEKDSIEDSEGDGLMLFDDPMFPPEFDDEDDDQ